MTLFAATDSDDCVRVVTGSRDYADRYALDHGGRVAEVTAEQAARATSAWPDLRTLSSVLHPEGHRTILVHVNVEAPADDARTADEVAAALMGAVEVGSDHESLSGLVVEVALAEEI